MMEMGIADGFVDHNQISKGNSYVKEFIEKS